jgi:GPI mannosyltransferase 3
MVVRKAVLIAVSIRLLLSLSTQTFFQPDEYFQSLEVAHHLVFGYGYLTWEWMSQASIRSIGYPLLYAPIYWILKFIKLDDTILLVGTYTIILILGKLTRSHKILAPKILSAVIASATDIWLWDLTEKVIGKRYSWTAVRAV